LKAVGVQVEMVDGEEEEEEVEEGEGRKGRGSFERRAS
jgi:hypothetical protein